MAVTYTAERAQFASTTNATAYSTAAFTPTPNSLLIMCVSGVDSAATFSLSTITEPSGTNLTWVNIRSGTERNDGTTWNNWGMYYCLVPASTVATVETITWSEAVTGCCIWIGEFAGHNASVPIGSSAVATLASGTETHALPGTVHTGSISVYMNTTLRNPPAWDASANGWTEEMDAGVNTPAQGMFVAYKANAQSIAFTGTNIISGSIIAEIDPNDATPAAVLALADVPSAVAEATAATTTTKVSAVAAVPTASAAVSIPADVTPTPIAALSGVTTPAVVGIAATTTTKVSATASIPTPTVAAVANATITPAATLASAAVPVPTVDASSGLTLSAVAVSTAVTTPTVVGTATVTPTPVAAFSTDVPAPAVATTGGVSLTTTTVSALSVVSTPSVTAAADVTPVAVLIHIEAPPAATAVASSPTPQSFTAVLLTLLPTLRPGEFITGQLLRNSAEGGTNEVQITTGNSGGASFDAFDVINGGTGTTPADRVVFSNWKYRHGGLSILTDSDTSGGEYVAWTTSWPDTSATCYIRAYFLMETLPASAANKLIRCYDSAGAEIAYFRVDASGNPGVGDATATFLEPSGPRVLLVDTWYRVAMTVTIEGTGSISASIYSGANLDNLTADYSWTLTPAATNPGVGNLAEIRFGNSILGTHTWFDDIGIRDDAPWGLWGTDVLPQSLGCELLTATPSLGLATLTATAPAQSFTANLLFTTTALYGAEIVNGLTVAGLLLNGAPAFPAGTLAVFGAQVFTASDFVVAWEALAATLTLESLTVSGSVDATVGQQRSSRKVTHMAKRFQVGEVAHLGATCKVLGVLTDPTTVTLQIIAPQGAASSYTWADAEIDHDGTGLFSFDLPLTDEGTWQWRWVTSGACTGADEGEILVRSSAFV